MSSRRAFRGLSLALLSVALAENAVAPVRADPAPPLVDFYTWGSNAGGELGTVPPNPTVASPLHHFGRWVAVSAGGQHALALTDTGEVWAWGVNDDGELGNGTTDSSFLPVRVEGLDGVTMISAGLDHNLAYRASDQTLWAWGSNALGQCAEPASVTTSLVPVPIPGLGPLAAISAGGTHSFALTTDGRVYAWGGNYYGQLGTGDFDTRFSPTEIALPAPATAVSAGNAHSAALLAPNGDVYTWGWNVFGQLGRGYQGTPGVGEPTPASASGLTGIAQISMGDLHSLALTTDGYVWAWGYNTEGQVGDGQYTSASTGILAPDRVEGVDQVQSIHAGGLHSIVLRTNGEVWTWGNNQFGACGNASRVDQHRPVRVIGVKGATAVSAGIRFSVVLAPSTPNTKVSVAGSTGATDGGFPPRPVTKTLDVPSGVMMVSSGFRHTVLLDDTRKVWAFGDNSFGQLGAPGPSSEDLVSVDLPLDGATGFVQVVARANQSYALRSDGAVFAWGDNEWGQLGTGSLDPVTGPTRVDTTTPMVAVAAGERHALTLDRSALVWAFGDNTYGQLGSPPTTDPVPVPAQVEPLFSSVVIAAGGFHSMRVDSAGGGVALWGAGFGGQLGVANLHHSAARVTAPLPRDVLTIVGGRFFTLALRSGGEVWAFGSGEECELGSSFVLSGPDPVLVPLPSAAIAIGAGDYHGLALTDSGALYGWGDDSAGQLGRADQPTSHFDCIGAPVSASASGPFGAGLAASVVAGP
jgi:alpha-tubulin suppressor-like RCC1 family protein